MHQPPSVHECLYHKFNFAYYLRQEYCDPSYLLVGSFVREHVLWLNILKTV